MTMHRATGGFVGMLALALALLAAQGSPALAQTGKGLIDPNTATESATSMSVRPLLVLVTIVRPTQECESGERRWRRRR